MAVGLLFGVLAVFMNSAAQVAIKLAGGFSRPLPLIIALGCYAISFYLTVKTYALFPLSLAQPAMAGAIFILTPAAAFFILGEHLSWLRIIGIVTIFVGVVLITIDPNVLYETP
jgi:small multidrug resistance pump